MPAVPMLITLLDDELFCELAVLFDKELGVELSVELDELNAELKELLDLDFSELPPPQPTRKVVKAAKITNI